MSTDPRIEAAARALYASVNKPHAERFGWDEVKPRWQESYRSDATAALAAADKAATITTFTGAEVNQAGWVCGACEPGDYAKCEDCQIACDDVAQFINRLNGATE